MKKLKKREKMKKKNQNRGSLKEFITHGIFKFHDFEKDMIKGKEALGMHSLGHDIYCRNTTKYLPLPLKFRKLLERKYFKWWVVILTVGIHKDVKFYAKEPIEFVINHIPEKHLMVISIRHPIDQFRRKAGVKIVKQRMSWALEHPKEERNWKHQLN